MFKFKKTDKYEIKAGVYFKASGIVCKIIGVNKEYDKVFYAYKHVVHGKIMTSDTFLRSLKQEAKAGRWPIISESEVIDKELLEYNK